MPQWNLPAWDEAALIQLLGEDGYRRFLSYRVAIEDAYEMETFWDKGFGEWRYEYKYRRGGKTLCTFYFKQDVLCLLVVLGKAEREKFEAAAEHFGDDLRMLYEQTATYHDGKWLWIPLKDEALVADVMRLLALKRRPNRKK